MNHFYEVELHNICNKLMLMGQKSIELVRSAMTALEENDGELALKVIAGDDEIDELEKKINADCVRYISLRSPVASDVRLLTFAMKASHDFERVGDEATSIAKRVPGIHGMKALQLKTGILPKLAEASLEQLQKAIACFIKRDTEVAHCITRADREIDDLHREHISILVYRTEHDQKAIQETVDLLFISKSLERVGDHAKSIAKEVLYMEGEQSKSVKTPPRS